ncbi:glycosyltransferase family 4 protein [Candidatus Bipolaricaulota bacterium]|nr:glycosyltransferase family 4 protein [Candidatus Bipolaricaulota bacterium]
MRIAIVRTVLHKGSGQVVHIRELARALQARGHEVTVFTLRAEERPEGVEVVEAPARRVWGLVRHFSGYQLVHSQYHPCLYAGGLAHRRGLPHVFTFHGFAPIRHWNSARQRVKMVRRRLGTFLGLRLGVDGFIAVSRFLADALASRYLVPRDRIEVVYNGVDISRFSPSVDGGKVREKYGLSGKKVVLYLGRLTRYKGAQFLLSAAPQVLREIPSAHFLIAGSLRNDVLDLPGMARRLGIERHVTFTGFVPDEDIPALYRAADLFCYPSLWEGFGLTPAEAMASGIPVVAFRCTAVPEVVVHGRTGLLVRPGDVAALAGAISTLLEDGERRHRMGQAGREHVLENFRWDLAAQRTEAVYQRVLEAR